MGPKSKPGATSKSKAKAEVEDRDEEVENAETTQDEKPQPSKPRKRKAKDKEEEDTSSAKPTTKTKKAKGPTVPIHADLPNNKAFPSKLQFDPKAEGCIRISAWNVCGVNACDKKGLKTYLQAEDPDIMIMSETKMQAEPDIMHLKHQYRYRYWGGDPKKGYAGVAILSKHKPLNVVYGLPTADDQDSTKGQFTDFHLIGTYTPNAGEGLQFMTRKNEWNAAFEKYLRELDAVKPVVWGGDINCALTEKGRYKIFNFSLVNTLSYSDQSLCNPGDLRNATTSWNKIAGYTQDECDALQSQLNPKEGSGHGKIVDAWRVSRPDLEGHYTYFSLAFDVSPTTLNFKVIVLDAVKRESDGGLTHSTACGQPAFSLVAMQQSASPDRLPVSGTTQDGQSMQGSSACQETGPTLVRIDLANLTLQEFKDTVTDLAKGFHMDCKECQAKEELCGTKYNPGANPEKTHKLALNLINLQADVTKIRMALQTHYGDSGCAGHRFWQTWGDPVPTTGGTTWI
ncbi:uncharacterized protein MELLADRAFT_105457 [Melampsora larici-populina 98AG31]|uniref:DNA-(apurinic or apyrimidinic site) endonuclease n=1 Tax=Melampsora larici-populina (strain 98AG31 / pathotype 3-4-7) TaxID=747676 RepID=F4RI69_MELLP|nr:uncharacterized protein MELLADRAFT_105457 [Melampsora larici-populina 98AG31]EGG07952.1 hypothetical protein MELLADRAFT_105457 [Melampsora larici-populina 98AG31]